MIVRQAVETDQEGWDRYVLGHAQGSPFHLNAWRKSIEETFSYESKHVVAETAGSITGVLPLFLVENFLVRKVLISSPFSVYGGILADSAEVREAIHNYVTALAKSLRVEYVELRNAYTEQCVGFANVPRYITFTQDIGPDEEAILESIPRKTRRMVRKSLQQGLESRRQATNFLAFEDLYSKNLRKLGTPSFPSKHFARLIANFGSMVEVYEVLHKDKVIAACMTFYFRDRVLPYYGASDPDYNSLAPNNFMYFDLMRWAGQNGYRVFDFGRSKKVSGSYDFKSHWGMQERDLPYEMLLGRRKSLPNYSPANPGFRLPIKVWQHLPLQFTRSVGPVLLRLVP